MTSKCFVSTKNKQTNKKKTMVTATSFCHLLQEPEGHRTRFGDIERKSWRIRSLLMILKTKQKLAAHCDCLQARMQLFWGSCGAGLLPKSTTPPQLKRQTWVIIAWCAMCISCRCQITQCLLRTIFFLCCLWKGRSSIGATRPLVYPPPWGCHPHDQSSTK